MHDRDAAFRQGARNTSGALGAEATCGPVDGQERARAAAGAAPERIGEHMRGRDAWQETALGAPRELEPIPVRLKVIRRGDDDEVEHRAHARESTAQRPLRFLHADLCPVP